MTFVVSGVGALVTHGNLVVAFDHPDFQAFAATKILGITSAAWMMIVIAIVVASCSAGRRSAATCTRPAATPRRPGSAACGSTRSGSRPSR